MTKNGTIKKSIFSISIENALQVKLFSISSILSNLLKSIRNDFENSYSRTWSKKTFH